MLSRRDELGHRLGNRNRELSDLRSVGPATVQDLASIGVTTIEQLAARNPMDLYESVCRESGVRHDPCLHDVFAAAVAQARDPYLPVEQRDWWYWSRIRKAGGVAVGGSVPPALK